MKYPAFLYLVSSIREKSVGSTTLSSPRRPDVLSRHVGVKFDNTMLTWAHSPGPLCCHTLVPVVMVGHVCPGRVVTYYHVPLHQCHHTSASYTVACSLVSPRANTVGDWKKNLWRHCSQGDGAGGGWEHMSTLGRQQVTESGDGNGERNKLQWAKIPRHVFVQTMRPTSDFHPPILLTVTAQFQIRGSQFIAELNWQMVPFSRY